MLGVFLFVCFFLINSLLLSSQMRQKNKLGAAEALFNHSTPRREVPKNLSSFLLWLHLYSLPQSGRTSKNIATMWQNLALSTNPYKKLGGNMVQMGDPNCLKGSSTPQNITPSVWIGGVWRKGPIAVWEWDEHWSVGGELCITCVSWVLFPAPISLSLLSPLFTPSFHYYYCYCYY